MCSAIVVSFGAIMSQLRFLKMRCVGEAMYLPVSLSVRCSAS
jgi:hypothetical protein